MDEKLKLLFKEILSVKNAKDLVLKMQIMLRPVLLVVVVDMLWKFREVKRNTPAKEELIEKFAEVTHGFVGADLESLVKEAAFNVVRRHFPDIDLNKR